MPTDDNVQLDPNIIDEIVSDTHEDTLHRKTVQITVESDDSDQPPQQVEPPINPTEQSTPEVAEPEGVAETLPPEPDHPSNPKPMIMALSALGIVLLLALFVLFGPA